MRWNYKSAFRTVTVPEFCCRLQKGEKVPLRCTPWNVICVFTRYPTFVRYLGLGTMATSLVETRMCIKDAFKMSCTASPPHAASSDDFMCVPIDIIRPSQRPLWSQQSRMCWIIWPFEYHVRFAGTLFSWPCSTTPSFWVPTCDIDMQNRLTWANEKNTKSLVLAHEHLSSQATNSMVLLLKMTINESVEKHFNYHSWLKILKYHRIKTSQTHWF